MIEICFHGGEERTFCRKTHVLNVILQEAHEESKNYYIIRWGEQGGSEGDVHRGRIDTPPSVVKGGSPHLPPCASINRFSSSTEMYAVRRAPAASVVAGVPIASEAPEKRSCGNRVLRTRLSLPFPGIASQEVRPAALFPSFAGRWSKVSTFRLHL